MPSTPCRLTVTLTSQPHSVTPRTTHLPPQATSPSVSSKAAADLRVLQGTAHGCAWVRMGCHEVHVCMGHGMHGHMGRHVESTTCDNAVRVVQHPEGADPNQTIKPCNILLFIQRAIQRQSAVLSCISTSGCKSSIEH